MTVINICHFSSCIYTTCTTNKQGARTNAFLIINVNCQCISCTSCSATFLRLHLPSLLTQYYTYSICVPFEIKSKCFGLCNEYLKQDFSKSIVHVIKYENFEL